MTLPEHLVEFVEGVYRETGAYPVEIAVPVEVWFPLQAWAQNICRFESATDTRGAAIVLAQGTRVRLHVADKETR